LRLSTEEVRFFFFFSGEEVALFFFKILAGFSESVDVALRDERRVVEAFVGEAMVVRFLDCFDLGGGESISISWEVGMVSRLIKWRIRC
jgi:hypothetical protein